MGGGIVIRIYFFFFRLIYLLEADLESVFDLPRSANRNFLTVVYTESFTPSIRRQTQRTSQKTGTLPVISF